MQGKPPKYTPIQLEKIKAERSKSTGSGPSDQPETPTMVESEIEVNQPQGFEIELVQIEAVVTKTVREKYHTREVSDTKLTEI